MKYTQRSEAAETVHSTACRVNEYGGTSQIDGATAHINGRYPEQGWAVNRQVTELIFVLGGKGQLITQNAQCDLQVGDMAIVDPGERYHFQGGDLRVLLVCTPPWTPDQYELA